MASDTITTEIKGFTKDSDEAEERDFERPNISCFSSKRTKKIREILEMRGKKVDGKAGEMLVKTIKDIRNEL